MGTQCSEFNILKSCTCNTVQGEMSDACDTCVNNNFAGNNENGCITSKDCMKSAYDKEHACNSVNEDVNADSDEELQKVEHLLEGLELSAGTLQALQEFMFEEKDRKAKLHMIQEGNIPDDFDEIWNLSQFWYSQDTAECLAQECLRAVSTTELDCTKSGANGNVSMGAIACIACPTLYRYLVKLQHNSIVNVLEFDTRFAVYGCDFVLYDYHHPLAVPHDLRDKFDVVVLDPPYLEEDCFSKIAVTAKLIAKPGAKIILITGLVMEDLAFKLLDVKKQNFAIYHDKERLSNPFGCFANYDLDKHCKYS